MSFSLSWRGCSQFSFIKNDVCYGSFADNLCQTEDVEIFLTLSSKFVNGTDMWILFLFSSCCVFILFYLFIFVYLSYGQLGFTHHKMSSNCRINIHIVKWLANCQILIKVNLFLSLKQLLSDTYINRFK